MNEVEGLALWRVVEQKGTDEQRQMVRRLVGYAAPILDRVIETFPTYTLHNSLHARNVAELMAKLLGERVRDLSALEAAFLILAVYWHDIGMVFRDEERSRLTNEPEWADFLQTHAEAYLAVGGDPKAEPPADTAEWYCRWRHANRVFLYLNDAAAQGLSFRWRVVDIREALGNLCRSHNEGIDRIQANAVLKPDYRAGEADLRFCAILLRLADILDFDRTRSPESVYQHLGLKRRSDARQEASDVEWRKHLYSEGFRFPDDRSAGYALDFIAGPDHPAVEHDLRQFLDTIEGEFEHCAALLPTCSKRWRDFALPARIKRDDITANGYRYGEYRFALDQHHVLDLLMGENLYENPYTFVREILQNALDASRLREHLERLRGNRDFEAQPIRVSEWLDRDRYRWVRFDDFGTGMDEPIVRDHLLKVGSSYYNSAQYRADVLRASKGAGSDFVPISRFGIGLLSCFIAGDRVEISTLRQLPDGSRATPVRLSLDGLHGFYTVQTPELAPKGMPSGSEASGEETGYRTEFGTSIAIRLDPRKEREPLDLAAILDEYVICPPVPVKFDGASIGGDPKELLETPWCVRTTIPLTPEQLQQIATFLRLELSPSDLQWELRPVDLTAHSFDVNRIRGQLVAFGVLMSESLALRIREVSSAVSVEADLHIRDSEIGLDLTLYIFKHELEQIIHGLEARNCACSILDWLYQLKNAAADVDVHSHGDYSRLSCTLYLGEWLLHLPVAKRRYLRYVSFKTSSRRPLTSVTNLILSHNGISVPTSIPPRWGVRNLLMPNVIHIGQQQLFECASTTLGIIALSDSFRPELAASREQTKGMPWRVYSAGNLSLFRAMASEIGRARHSGPDDLFAPLVLNDYPSLGMFLEDIELQRDGRWSKEPLFNTRHGLLSLDEIRLYLNGGSVLEITNLPDAASVVEGSASATTVCAAVLATAYLDIVAASVNYKAGGVKYDPPRDGELLWPPLSFTGVGNDKYLWQLEREVWRPAYNREHALSRWIINVGPSLLERYPGIFSFIRFHMLTQTVGRFNPESFLAEINAALQRLADGPFELRPPKSVFLKRSDFD